MSTTMSTTMDEVDWRCSFIDFGVLRIQHCTHVLMTFSAFSPEAVMW
jgi:hypothetical protein